MTTQARTAKAPADQPAPAKKAPGKKTPAKGAGTGTGTTRTRRPRKGTQPLLSLVKDRPGRPRRKKPFMTDTQGFATLAARIVGIPTANIRDWKDHRDDTCTRTLRDGSTLHYNLDTRTLTWQAVCRMGAIHEYPLNSPSAACVARLHADRCEELHADLTKIPALTRDELEDLGIHTGPTWARPDVLGEDITDTIHVPLPTPEPEPTQRALGDTLTHSTNATDETHPMSLTDIAEGLAARTASADTEPAKEHPDHG
ncbi:hypothetical protein AB0G67_40185 [Streptomyces sp. NPDC021056]|uniref:hypothetical protein n=1 Tax=Streptomyces sp. NPDC021056 TaxID=3155012 RepID=UPI0033FEE1A3